MRSESESVPESVSHNVNEPFRRLVEAKLASFHSLFSSPQHSTRAYEHSGFILRLILDGGQIKFEPDFPDFELVLINVFDVMIKNVGMIPRVETKLYSEWVSTQHHLSEGQSHWVKAKMKKVAFNVFLERKFKIQNCVVVFILLRDRDRCKFILGSVHILSVSVPVL